MDKKALQEQFEAIAIQNCWNINKYPAGWDGHGDDEYADDFVNGAWWAFQHQQSKVEELQTQLSLQRQRVKAFEEELTSSRNYGDELQKRVEILEATLESERWDREAGFKVFFKARDTQGQWHGFESKPEFYEVGEYWWKGGRSIYLYGDEYCDRDTAKKSLTAVKEQALKGGDK